MSRRHVRYVVAPLCVLILLGGLYLSPIGRPADVRSHSYLSPRFGKVKRVIIQEGRNARGATFLPRFVTVRTNGPPIRAYLADLTSCRGGPEFVSQMLQDTDAVERGGEPAADLLREKAVDVTEARLDLPYRPWKWRVSYLLILYGEQETDVEVCISYGG
ncbi:MAG: hypothetical protein ACYC3X_28855 [Pirellulaceae bacterium]